MPYQLHMSQSYDEFVEKFKPKKTTDDCFTPPNIYEAVVQYVEKRYHKQRERFLRPFWPGEDYTNFHYPPGCVVVDNPPFSILSKILDFYMENGVDFFLFSPSLVFSNARRKGITQICTCAEIIYENGARVTTNFVTNFEPKIIARTDAALSSILKEENEKNKKDKTAQRPNYTYTDNVITSAMLEHISRRGVDISLPACECYFVRSLDSQRAVQKSIFGNGFLVSDRLAAEKAAAEKAAAEKAAAKKAAAKKAHIWQLSENEKSIIKHLNQKGGVQRD